ncbi:MAG: hypothetical protein COV69_00740 [Parcubacteria group bacterium CG11_big_fil_rev_8_21_14_0_20_39_14]|nr:MAG: hypothetical protein COV69_00740 [Parcubacteria group bacterium CG11_big_fil_rev_8_21_14_0_20_39_14]PIS35728.1 MAG: hypothetical protein COT36_00675 [Parcubacteria group bacterium CG08_land_8_20_14_0_20_38_56]
MRNAQEEIDLKTIVWFDIFNWPLTLAEIKKYSNLPPDMLTSACNVLRSTEAGQVMQAGILSVGESRQNKAIENSDGFYFLKGRKEIIRQRILRQKIAVRKIKIAKKATKILSFIPFVKMAAVCNDLAYFNAPSESDIDFFIIVRRGRIWLTRFLATLTLFILGLWRHGEKIKDRICLSFFITDDNLNLKKFAYIEDTYLKYWVLQIRPLFDRAGAYQNFLKENYWVLKDFPNFFSNISSPKIKIRRNSLQLSFEKILGGRFGNFLEKFFKKIQLRTMKKKRPVYIAPAATSRMLAGAGRKDVIISDKILKFHEKDRRKHFQRVFKERLKEVCKNNNSFVRGG